MWSVEASLQLPVCLAWEEVIILFITRKISGTANKRQPWYLTTSRGLYMVFRRRAASASSTHSMWVTFIAKPLCPPRCGSIELGCKLCTAWIFANLSCSVSRRYHHRVSLASIASNVAPVVKRVVPVRCAISIVIFPLSPF